MVPMYRHSRHVQCSMVHQWLGVWHCTLVMAGDSNPSMIMVHKALYSDQKYCVAAPLCSSCAYTTHESSGKSCSRTSMKFRHPIQWERSMTIPARRHSLMVPSCTRSPSLVSAAAPTAAMYAYTRDTRSRRNIFVTRRRRSVLMALPARPSSAPWPPAMLAMASKGMDDKRSMRKNVCT